MSNMALNDFQDVTITNPVVDQKIAYDGSKWVNYYAKILLTYDEFFKSKTITISKGQTSTTKTLPSDSLECILYVGSSGVYEISYDQSGYSFSTSVEVEGMENIYYATLVSSDTITVTLHSAKGDTVTYTDIDGIEKTAVFDSNSTNKTVDIAITISGIAIEFTSLIAKDPNNPSNSYSKTVVVTGDTTDIYLMPDNTLYWFGYESSDLEDCTTANGWSAPANNSLVAPVHQSNYIDIASSTNQVCAVATKTAIANHKKSHSIVKGITAYADTYGNLMLTANANKAVQTYASLIESYISDQIVTYNKEINMVNDTHVMSVTSGVRAHRLYALWYELQS